MDISILGSSGEGDVMTAEIAEAKRALRQIIRRCSKLLPASYFQEAGRLISERACRTNEYQLANTVLGFASMENEPDTSEFLRHALREKRLALPVCRDSGMMEAREIQSKQDLVPGKYGIWEPAPHCPLVPVDEIQFALIPCVSCDITGKRLGHGGGYYDRYLAAYSKTAALVCPAALLSDRIPVDAYDIAIPFVITESAVYRNGH